MELTNKRPGLSFTIGALCLCLAIACGSEEATSAVLEAETMQGAEAEPPSSIEPMEADQDEGPILLITDLSQKGADEVSDEMFQEGLAEFIALREIRRGDQTLVALRDNYYYFYEASCEVVTVPEDFTTLLAPPPELAGRYNVRRFAEATIIHNWLYAAGVAGDRAGRAKADEVWRAALIESKLTENDADALLAELRRSDGARYGEAGTFQFYDFRRDEVVERDTKPASVYQDVRMVDRNILNRFGMRVPPECLPE